MTAKPAEPTPDPTPGPSRRPGREPAPLLPDRTRDETPEAWGEPHDDNLDRLLDERPPHW
jgi:hypothetical protein